MEGLVTVLCWLFNSEQHFGRSIVELREQHKGCEIGSTNKESR